MKGNNNSKRRENIINKIVFGSGVGAPTTIMMNGMKIIIIEVLLLK